MNQAQMMAQVRKMQAEMEKAQAELSTTTVTGSAAGEMVKIEMSGDFAVHSVRIAKEAVDPEDIETLEDLLIVAMKDAIAKVQDISGRKMGALTGGMRIPGLM